MATGDLLQKRSGSFGLAYESTPGTAEAAPIYFLTCDDANIIQTPKRYERVNNIGAEMIGIQQSKYDASFEFSGGESSIEIVGYLLWLMLGAETNSPLGTHAIAGQFDSHYLTAFVDHGGKFTTANEVRRAAKCRFGSLTIEQNMAEYAKISGSGLGTVVDAVATGFSPSLDLSAGAAPLSWASLSQFQVGYDGVAATANDYVKSFSLTVEREINPSAYKISSELPNHIAQGGRRISGSFVMDLQDSDAHADDIHSAAAGNQDLEISMVWTTGTQNLAVTINQAKIQNSPFGGVGSGADAQEVTVEWTAYQDDADLPIDVIAIDGNTADYDAR